VVGAMLRHLFALNLCYFAKFLHWS